MVVRVTGLVVWVLCAGLLAACAGLETGNGSKDESMVTVSFALREAATALNVRTITIHDADGATLTVTRAVAHVRQLEFHLPPSEHCVDLLPSQAEPVDGVRVTCTGRKVRVDGGFELDLLAATMRPDMGFVPVPAGDYSRIDVEFAPAETADGVVAEPSGLAGHSIVIDGHIGGEEVRIVLDSREVVQFEADTPIPLAFGDLGMWLGRLDPQAWLGDLPLAACVASGELRSADGRWVVGDRPSECRGLTRRLPDALRAAGRLEPR